MTQRLVYTILLSSLSYNLIGQDIHIFLGLNSKQIFETGLPVSLTDEFQSGLGLNSGIACQFESKKLDYRFELYGTWGHSKMLSWKGATGLGGILSVKEIQNKYLLHGVGFAFNPNIIFYKKWFVGPRFGIEYRSKYIQSSSNFRSSNLYYHLGLTVGLSIHNFSIYGVGKADVNPFYKSISINNVYRYNAYSSEWSINIAYRIFK
jgi:hypothetical protein